MLAIKYIILSMRPKQWTKNVVLFAALVFSQNLFNPMMLFLSLAAFAVFAVLSGGVYLFNDLIDIEEDKRHPGKSNRPIAAGLLAPPIARVAFFAIVSMSLVASLMINTNFAIIALSYFVVQIAYSLFFKHIVIIDVFSISAGFFLRVVAGATAIAVPISSWLLVCTFFISLFLALCKRRHEMVLLENGAVTHRKVLESYNVYLLDQMIGVVTSSTLITYTLYTLSAETVSKFNTTNLKYTIPFVLYGIYRYLYLVYRREEGGSPELVFMTDRPMLINILLYGFTAVFVLYIS